MLFLFFIIYIFRDFLNIKTQKTVIMLIFNIKHLKTYIISSSVLNFVIKYLK